MFGFRLEDASERFCVRNSGALAVVEGIGDHGCEYMTGGRVVCLGPTGINFGAGMSGGIAYVYDPARDFPMKCNMGMITLEQITSTEEAVALHGYLSAHAAKTGSTVAVALLESWPTSLRDFVKVMPSDYKRVLDHATEGEEAGAAAALL